ncbi:MAG: ABC transporter substrate-binding protein [Dehalococcoidia bacterium]
MNESGYWQKVAAGGLNRRAFLRSAAVTGVGAAAFLAGCGTSAPEKPAAGGTGGAGGTATPAASAGVFANPKGKKGGTITDVGLDPTTGWDPHGNIGYLTGTITEPLGIKLIRHDYTGIKTKWTVGAEELIIGELAEKWETPDALTYNMTIRKGLNWPNQEPMNGRPITAKDVVYNFKHYALPTSQVQTWVSNNIKSCTAIDDNTVQFKLNYPHWRWAGDLDSYNTMIQPEGLYEWAKGDVKEATKARGGGPWILDSYQAGSVARFIPNESYRKFFGVPYADKLNVAILATGSPRLQAWAGKNVQFFTPLPGQMDTAKKARPESQWTTNYAATNTNALFMKTAQKPFDDVRVRRALSMSVDRDGWGKTLQNEFKWESGPITWGYPTWKLDHTKMPAETQKWLKVDIAEAKKLIDAAGVTTAKTFTIHMYPYSPDYTPEAQFLIDSLKKIGVNSALKVYEYNNWLATAYTGKYEDLLYGPDNLDRVTQQLSDRFTATSERNHSGVQDAEMQKMLADFGAAKTPADAKAVSDKIQTRSVDQAFAVYRPQPVSPLTWDPSIQNYDGQAPILYHTFYRDAFSWLG